MGSRRSGPPFLSLLTSPQVTDFLKKTFSNVVDPATQKPREVFAHITTATDTSNVKRVFEAVELTITNQSLQMAGII